MASPADLDQFLRPTEWPELACPICAEGLVGFKTANAQPDRESRTRLAASRPYGPEQEELAGSFTGILACGSRRCAQTFAMAGDWVLSWDVDPDEYEPTTTLVDFYKVRYINPALPLLLPPRKTPGSVTAEIEAAAEILFVNPGGAGNRLRSAVEQLMTAQRVPKTRLTKSNKRVRLTLHERIEKFSAGRRELGAVLLAVKWIGNGASHGPDLTVADIVLCADVLDAALKELYDDSGAKLQTLVKDINRRRGLVRRQRPSTE